VVAERGSDGIVRFARLLANAEFKSPSQLAAGLGCAERDVPAQVAALRNLGLDVEAVPGRGYRLREALELLDRDNILARLDRKTRHALTDIVVEGLLDSTNSTVQKLPPERQHATAVLAECQRAGRGRRGRQWHSPFGGNLYLSLGWCFESALAELGCLPLVVALAAAEALTRAGLSGHAVKWPNDLVLQGRKLCGCLVEMQGEPSGPCRAVLGVGVNVRMPSVPAGAAIGQPWTDLRDRLQDGSRNRLAALLLEVLLAYLPRFGEQGFAPFMPLWEEHDVLRGRVIELTTGEGTLQGLACGIDVNGSLLLDTGDGLKSLRSGEVRVQSGWAA